MLHQTMDSGASLTGDHVVHLHPTDLEHGSSLMMEGWFQIKVVLQHFTRSRGDDGTVNLNHLNSDVMMPTGRFCCVVPDDTSTYVTLCADIGEWM